MSKKEQINSEFISSAAVRLAPIAMSSSDGKVYSDSISFGRRLDGLRQQKTTVGSCTHTGWDS